MKPAPDSLEAALGHAFRSADLLETALSHPSYAHETDRSRGNERLEFLGDAVLDLVTAQLLFEAHPDWSEGELTRARAALVNQGALAHCARTLDLGRFVKLGRTEQRSRGKEKDSILANCLEALIGAVYLDGGLEAALALARRLFGSALEPGADRQRRDPKTELQEWAHASRRVTPTYHTIADSGTDDDEARFTVEVRLGAEAWGRGIGRSKRTAERTAARAALERVARDD